jgi:hypothetical protein
LAALRRLIVDQRRIAEHYAYAGELVEFIKDDPEYMEIMSVLNEILEKQRKRVHEMECNDEMPPAPYVDLAQACN